VGRFGVQNSHPQYFSFDNNDNTCFLTKRNKNQEIFGETATHRSAKCQYKFGDNAYFLDNNELAHHGGIAY